MSKFGSLGCKSGPKFELGGLGNLGLFGSANFFINISDIKGHKILFVRNCLKLFFFVMPV